MEDGTHGTRAWDADETRLVQASREARQQRLRGRKTLRRIRAVLVTAVAVFAASSFLLFLVAKTVRQRAKTAELERSIGQVDAILNADTSAVAALLQNLESVREDVLFRLRELDASDLPEQQRAAH